MTNHILNSNGALNLGNLATGKNKKDEVAKMKKLIEDIDFVVKKNEVTVAIAIATFTGLKERYDNYAINTTILKHEDKKDEEGTKK